MNCPICTKPMQRGDILFKTPWPGAFYPQQPGETPAQRKKKMWFGSKDCIGFSGAEESWYCADCKKVVAMLRTDKDDWVGDWLGMPKSAEPEA